MAEWSLSELRTLCDVNGWVMDQKPDPERGLYATPGGVSIIRLTLPGGGAVIAESGDGLLNGCLPKIGRALEELGIQPHREPVSPNQYEHGGAGARFPT